jgi:8-amino-7-oxononanoate synthase
MLSSMPHMSDSRNWFANIAAHSMRHFSASQRDGMYIRMGERQLVNFASNDYLGLSFHPDVCTAARDAIDNHGLGSGASRLVSGDNPMLHALEARLARWKGYQACLIVGSGMLANIGLLQALANRHTHIFADKLNHASLIDGALLSDATSHRFGHLNTEQLDQLLSVHAAEKRIIVSDGVFSMDGDCADLSRLLQLAEQHETLLVIDDAHGTGTVGTEGCGLSSEYGIAGHSRLIEVGTFGKAFGSYGAFILGTHELIDGLRQRLRTMIYSTALPVAVVAAADAALTLIESGEVVQSLQDRLSYFRQQAADLPMTSSTTAIQPLILGSNERALQAAAALREAGFFVPAIRPPTVPEGTARLRITISAAHTHEQIDELVSALRLL